MTLLTTLTPYPGDVSDAPRYGPCRERQTTMHTRRPPQACTVIAMVSESAAGGTRVDLLVASTARSRRQPCTATTPGGGLPSEFPHDAHRGDMTSDHRTANMSGESNQERFQDVGGLGHYGGMTPRQLLLRGPERTSAELDLVENRTGAPSASFEDITHGIRVPRFGGASLLKAAARALARGYQVRKFELVGADRAAIREIDSERVISDQLVDALERSGPSGVQGLLRHDYQSYLVCGVEMYSTTTRVVTLRRNGVMVGADDEKLWVFIHAVLEDDVS